MTAATTPRQEDGAAPDQDADVLEQDLAADPPVREVAEALRNGFCPPDHVFDRFLPRDLRLASSVFWTPLAVAARAARWLEECHVKTVVDIGSGSGKFCVAGALTGGCRFIGIEHRPYLVEAARSLARLFEVEARVSFDNVVFGRTRAPEAEAYYLYNPFGENILGRRYHLDEDVELTDTRYQRDVAATEALLHDARLGTYILTLNGFGGRVPLNYETIRSDSDSPSGLWMFRKARRAARIGSVSPPLEAHPIADKTAQ